MGWMKAQYAPAKSGFFRDSGDESSPLDRKPKRDRTVSAAGLPLGTIEEQRKRAKRAGKLDCYFCGLGHNDFNSLAFHVANDCRMAPANKQREEKTTMAKQQRRDERDERKPSGSGDKFPPFLGADDVGDVGEQAQITLTGKQRFNSSQYGEQLVCECTLGRKTYSFGIKSGSKNHKALQFIGMPKKGMTLTLEVQSWDAPDGRNVKFLSIVSA